jgi:hypothetical protein
MTNENLEDRARECEFKNDCDLFYRLPNVFVLDYCIGNYEMCKKYVVMKSEKYGRKDEKEKVL